MRQALLGCAITLAFAQTPEADPLLTGLTLYNPKNCPVFIGGVAAGSPAERAGVRAGDRLLAVGEVPVQGGAQASKLLQSQQPAPAAVAAAPVAAKEVTGSIAPPAAVAAPVPLPAPKPEIARLPTVEGWVLRDAGHGSALIEGRQGIFEVFAGDPVPGLGRVDAIRKQDGKWVVVTSKGLIVAR